MITRELKKSALVKSRAVVMSRVVSLLGKYRGKGLLQALVSEKQRERKS